MKNSVFVQYGNLTFSVEYATELLGVLSILCNDQDAICDAGKERCNIKYRADVLAFFHEWQGCEVTKILEQLSDSYNFNFDAPVDLMLQRAHHTPIDLEQLCLHRKPIPQELFDHFLFLIDRFERDSNFESFYESHRQYYHAVIDNFVEDYKKHDPLTFLREYLGIHSNYHFHINFMLGITNSNYGVSVKDHIYANLCPNGKTRFGSYPDYAFSTIYWTTLIVHEFAHAFVNPITARSRTRIATINIDEYRSILKEMMYGECLETYINETIIRAIECLYVKKSFFDCYEEYVQDYIDEGFIKIRDVIMILSKKDKSLENSFEQILDLFR